MIVGFIGTRRGMNDRQKTVILDILRCEEFDEYHHGDCVGCDKMFHELVVAVLRRKNLYPKDFIFIHPPTNFKIRAYCEDGTIYTALPYLERNRSIVDVCDLLIATPDKYESLNKARSSTWFTIRYAKKQEKDIIIIT